ncbi:ubiquitin family protein [Alkalihalobacterium elongatum]|uniref:methyltransferase n=1 Tax=Alkalihalobacterium elongatum TaxID=2675466 RepID=UPI001C1F6C0E|nr:methyltransferase [Alkalihalobacterium elongatum]
MDKVLVEVYIPASDDTYDVFIPLKSKLYEVSFLLANTVAELSQGYFVASENMPICDRQTGEVLDINKTVEELQLKNGSKLMLL